MWFGHAFHLIQAVISAAKKCETFFVEKENKALRLRFYNSSLMTTKPPTDWLEFTGRKRCFIQFSINVGSRSNFLVAFFNFNESIENFRIGLLQSTRGFLLIINWKSSLNTNISNVSGHIFCFIKEVIENCSVKLNTN